MTEDPLGKYMLLDGSATNGATMLEPKELVPLCVPSSPVVPLGEANFTERFLINQTGTGTWQMNKRPYIESDWPTIDGEKWNTVTIMQVPANATVDIVLETANNS